MSDATIDAKIQQLKELDTQILKLAAQRKQLVVELEQARNTISELLGQEEKGESIDVLELTARVANSLKANEIYYLTELCGYSEQELLRMPFLGKISCRQIKEVLATRGFSLK